MHKHKQNITQVTRNKQNKTTLALSAMKLMYDHRSFHTFNLELKIEVLHGNANRKYKNGPLEFDKKKR